MMVTPSLTGITKRVDRHRIDERVHSPAVAVATTHNGEGIIQTSGGYTWLGLPLVSNITPLVSRSI